MYNGVLNSFLYGKQGGHCPLIYRKLGVGWSFNHCG